MKRGLVVALLWIATARAQEADFSVEAIRKRIEILRPDLEAALGASLGDPVEVVVTTPDALADLIANDYLAERGNIEGGPRGDGLKDAAAVAGRAWRYSVLGTVERGGILEICPENFRVLADIEPSWKGILDPDSLDVLLLHELVHVFQERRFAGFVGAPSSLEQLQARHAVLEGHAQYVAREAAKRRGLDAAFALYEKSMTEVPPSVKDPALRRSYEAGAAQMAFAYIEGEKFFRAVAEKLGYEKALARVFSSPPATVRAIRKPAEYLAPATPTTPADRLSTPLRRLLEERYGTAKFVPFSAPLMRTSLAMAGPRVAAQALSGVEAGVGVTSEGGSVGITLHACRDEAAAALLCETVIRADKALDRLPGDPLAKVRVLSAQYSPVSIEGWAGIEERTIWDLGAGFRRRVVSVLLRRRNLVLGVFAERTGPTPAVTVVREALELIRGAEVTDRWDGKKGDEARRALVDALADPYWGVRWRATRNLARLDAAPEIDACLVRMLKDPDVSVRCAALRGLVARGWLNRAAPEERDAPAADPDGEVALTYHRAMTDHQIDAATKTSRLLKALGDPHAEVRAYAFQNLNGFEEAERIPWERLRAGIEDADGDVRIAAIFAWGWNLPPEARDVLLKALADEEVLVREQAAQQLHHQLDLCAILSSDGVKDWPGFVDAMIRALGDESPIVRGEAAWMVGQAGNAAWAAVPALVRMLDDPLCHKPAAEALGSIGVADPDAMRKLDAALASADLDDRFEAARALWRLGHVPEGLLSVFVEMLRIGKNRRRGDAAQVLGEMGEAARPYVGDLIAALANENSSVRYAVIGALGNLGSIAKEAIPELEKVRDEDPDDFVGRPAERAIEKIRAAAAREGR